MVAPQVEDFETYIQTVRARRAEMRESLAAVDDALAVPLGKPLVWRERVRAALAELAHDFEDHIGLTECTDGLFSAILDGHPRLVRSVETLLAEHSALREDIAGCLAILDRGDAIADLPAFREELTALVGQLVRHRQRGSDLIYEAYAVDIGGQD
ncbi:MULTISPECIES: hemerythrin domain-containing protein [unclassified Ornithinimicrobium]|uniref:hemerythrin domain-containing protein n=1 Tax=unclassified Ornithinimicrobium TaxID=2615080 RepID=UPI003854C959